MTKRSVKTLIVGVDFSKYSKTVVSQAKKLSSKLNLPLVYVHVFDDPVVSEVALSTVLGSLRTYYDRQVRTEYNLSEHDLVIVRCGQAFRVLLDIAKKFKRPLIIVGHRGHTGALTRFFIGSTAERLALRSPYPVWIHRGRKTVLPKDVLIPCDLSARSQYAYNSINSIGLKNKLGIELYHVLQPPLPLLDYSAWAETYEEIKKEDARKVRTFKKKFPTLKVVETNDDISENIEKHGRNFDLIAITPREHKGIFTSFGSVTSKVVRQGDTSVLVLP